MRILFLSRLVAAAGLLLAGQAGGAVGKNHKLFFAGSIVSEGGGFRCANLQSGQAQPLPPAEKRTRSWQDGRTETVYNPVELWFAGEYLGRWANRDGDSLMLAQARSVLPGALRNKSVPHEEFDKQFADAPAVTADNVEQWMADFLGAKPGAEARTISQLPMSLSEVRTMSATTGGVVRVGYAFRFRASAAAPNTNRWLFAMFSVSSFMDVVALSKDIEREFLPTIQPQMGVAGRNSSGPKALSSVPGQADAASPGNRSAAFMASRQAALDSLKGMKGWWYVETTNYMIVTDLPSGKAVVIKEIQKQIEYLRSAYARVVPPADMLNAASIIRFFGDAAGYERYVDPSMKWTGGYWDPRRGELVIRPREWGDAVQKNAWLRETLYHEGFHQYLSYAFHRGDAAVWYNEGHAAMMEGIEFTTYGVKIDEVPRYAEQVAEHMKKEPLRIDDLLPMDHAAFYSSKKDSDDDRKWNYARAWALVYYLRKGAPLEKGAPWAGLAEKYRAAFAETYDGAKATEKCFEGVDMIKFHDSLNAFWKSGNRRSDARRFDLFAQKTETR